MSDQLLIIAPWGVFAVLALAIWLWRRASAPAVISELVESVVPDQFDDVAKHIVSLAVSAVEQRIKAYEKLTNAERLALAKKYAAALLDYAGRDLSDLAVEALIEAELWLRHQVIEDKKPKTYSITVDGRTLTAPLETVAPQPENWSETVALDADFLKALQEAKPLAER